MSDKAVIRFISRFTNTGKYDQVIEAFTCGCCFWFAQILSERFGGTILFDDIEGHFATKIGERVYDVRGDITHEQHHWNRWDSWEDPANPSGARMSVVNGCILFSE